MIDVVAARRNMRRVLTDETSEKIAATYVGSFGGGGAGGFGGMPQMPPASVGGGMGGAKIVGGWGGGGGGKLTGSRAGSAMVGRHRANMMVQGMMQQNDFAKSYANALGRMSRGHARIKTSARLRRVAGLFR